MTLIYTLGPVGSFSSKVAMKLGKGMNAIVEYRNSIQEVVKAALEGNFAILPLHNVYGGVVNDTFDALSKSDGVLQTLTFVSQHVSHCLSSNHNETIGEISTVYSHPQALAQCERYLKYIGARGIPARSTTEMLHSLGYGEAVLCSPDAATEAGLHIIDDDVAPSDNMTTFALMANEGHSRIFKNNLPVFLKNQ